MVYSFGSWKKAFIVRASRLFCEARDRSVYLPFYGLLVHLLCQVNEMVYDAHRTATHSEMNSRKL